MWDAGLRSAVKLLLHLLREQFFVQFELLLLRELVLELRRLSVRIRQHLPTLKLGMQASIKSIAGQIVRILLDPQSDRWLRPLLSVHAVLKRHLLHGHLDPHSFFELHLLNELELRRILRASRPCNVGLRSGDLVIGIIVVIDAELAAALTVAHHHVALQFLLLGRIQFPVFVIAVVFFLFTVLVIFVSLTETRFVMPFLAMLSICVLRGELFLAGVKEHVMVLRCHHLLRGIALPVELVCVELNDGVGYTGRRHCCLHRESLRLEVASVVSYWLLRWLHIGLRYHWCLT